MTEAFDLQFKNSIRYGMTYNQFWFDDPQLYYIYEEAYLDGLKERDIFNWQLGAYIQLSVGSCLAKECKYPQKPIFYASEKQKPKTTEDMLEQFKIMAMQVNSSIKNKK